MTIYNKQEALFKQHKKLVTVLAEISTDDLTGLIASAILKTQAALDQMLAKNNAENTLLYQDASNTLRLLRCARFAKEQGWV